jgi:hypothetical protein
LENNQIFKRHNIEQMVLSNVEQIKRKQIEKLNEKIYEKKFFEENMIPQLMELQEEKNLKEKERIMSIKKYKEDLDKQIEENRKIKFGYLSPNQNYSNLNESMKSMKSLNLNYNINDIKLNKINII